MRYANQKRITIKKAPIGPNDYYLRVRKDALRSAAQHLKAGAFKLYIYLADNKQDFDLCLSQIAVERDFGIKKNQYYNAINELVEKGYLYRPDPEKNNWLFVEDAAPSQNRKETSDRTILKEEEVRILLKEEDPKREEVGIYLNKEGNFPKEETGFPKGDKTFMKPVEKDNDNREDKEYRVINIRVPARSVDRGLTSADFAVGDKQIDTQELKDYLEQAFPVRCRDSS